MSIIKQQIQNLLGVSRAWVNKRMNLGAFKGHNPTHGELVAMIEEWKAQKPECQERARWTIGNSAIVFAWRPGYFVAITKSHTPHIFVSGVTYSTKTIADRFLDGWHIDDMASDYKCDRLAIEAAIAFELKARAV